MVALWVCWRDNTRAHHSVDLKAMKVLQRVHLKASMKVLLLAGLMGLQMAVQKETKVVLMVVETVRMKDWSMVFGSECLKVD